MIKYNVLDLFCGCGGFTKGFEEAGFTSKLGIDIWIDATITYHHNFPDSVVINSDITEVTSEQLLNACSLTASDVDVIIGGPPCQGFSISGKRSPDDPRNDLYKSFVRMVGDISPKIFVMENVPGLISMANGQIKDKIISDFSDLGYNVSIKIMAADDFGVPQHRRRVFIVGLNQRLFDKITFQFPVETNNMRRLYPYVSCKDALSDLDFIPDDSILGDEIDYALPATSEYQRLMRENSSCLYNHVATIHTKQTKSIIAMVPDGGDYRCLPKELWSTRKVHIAWTRMKSDKACFTIDTGHNHQFHYSENRVPTVRESARIQSFPDTFRFIGIKTSQLQQVGNAVPPLLAKAVATQVKKYLINLEGNYV